jgi:pSer/pThr/pTyr-binding forkhead associated (FHA) protein
VVIPDSRVSRFHAEIRRDGDRLVVYDLDSTNGTLVGGRPVQKHTLKDGDEISLGGYLAHIRVHKD